MLRSGIFFIFGSKENIKQDFRNFKEEPDFLIASSVFSKNVSNSIFPEVLLPTPQESNYTESSYKTSLVTIFFTNQALEKHLLRML